MTLPDMERLEAIAEVTPSMPPDFRALFDASPTPLLVIAAPDWIIVAANEARLQVTGTTREEQIGRRLFEVFPDDPSDPDADGVRNLTASLGRVVAFKTADTMAVQRYSLKEADGRYAERWWAPVNTPVIGVDGEVDLVIHYVEDVTEVMHLRGDADGKDLLARAQQTVIDRLRASELALRDAEERYLALFNAIDQGFCTIEVTFDKDRNATDYRFLEISPSFERQTGIENGLGRWMREIAPDEDQFWFDTYGRVALTGEPARLENYSPPLDRWFDVYAFRISGENRVAILFRDITDHKRAETRLRESEQRFRNMADRSPVMMWVTDSSGYCTHLNARWYEFTGQAAGAGEGYGWLDAVHPEDRPAAEEAFATANAERRDHRIDFRLRRADGVYRWTIDAAAARFDLNGEYLGYIGSVIDIDERREAEDALRESDSRLRALNADLERRVTERALARSRTWQLSPDIMGVLNADGLFEQSNPAWQSILGWSEAELASTLFFDFVHPDDLPKTQGVFADAIERGQPALRFENRYRSKGGDWHWLSWVAVPDEGKIYCSARDVTVEKERAQALAYTEEALRQSQKMEAMGQLTGGVAHDFNNLLTPIVGILDMLQRRGIGGDREQQLIAGAMQSADRAKTLVQRLLAFARRQPLQATAVDVAALVTGIADLVASTSGPQIKVVVETAEELPSAQADPNQLEMALLNLGVNARDAMPDGGTLRITAICDTVEIGHRSKLRPGQYIRLSVADTGMGMDEVTARRAVEPFFSTKGVGKGTGLELSMVHGLALQLGGAMMIDSRPAVGTNVELWLPISATRAEAPKPSVKKVLSPTVKGKALLVDDEEIVRMSTAYMLAELGYAVIEAGSADEALRLLEDGQHFDLLVTDHLMPGLSGTELAREVRRQRPGMPVMVVSGYAEAEGIAPDLPRLVKPFKQSDLAAKLCELHAATGGMAGAA